MPSEEKLLQNPEALCNMVRRIALEAGEIIMGYYENLDMEQVDTKLDDSPVTLADREAETYIQMSLQAILPDITVIGEEAVALGKAPTLSGEEYFWLVDPLDGTKEFIKGGEDFTVNIGLIKSGEPVLGVIYVPARGDIYAGYINEDGSGKAVKSHDGSDSDKEISVRPSPAEGLTVVASASHGNKADLETFLSEFKVAKVIARGSSLKICEIAAGKADIYPRLGPTCEWDTAAGHAVLKAAGGRLTMLDGQELQYGGVDPKFLNPHFVASSFDWHTEPE